jgi:hypothetical protein
VTKPKTTELCMHRVVNTQTGRCQDCNASVMKSHDDRIVALEKRVAELEDLVCALAVGDLNQNVWNMLDALRMRRMAERNRGGA